MLKRAYHERGDTLIEVLLAVTIFSMVAAGALLIMNQSINSAQRAVEVTLVRQQIDAQAEALRAIHEAASKQENPRSGEWLGVTQSAANLSHEGEDCPVRRSQLPSNAFALNPQNAERLTGSWYGRAGSGATEQPPFAQVSRVNPSDPTSLYQAYGIWIEAQSQSLGANTPGVYTFRIRACWDAVGLEVPQRIETIVRLYEL